MAQQPNLLLLLPDQWRPDWLGLHGKLSLTTPNIDALAARGVLFENAYTPSPLCAPARACLASGRSYRDCGVPNNNHNYPLSLPTYYQSLRDAGYRVASVGKLDLHKDVTHPANMDWGLDGFRLMKEWGFTDGIDNEGKIDGVTSYIRSGNNPKGPYLHFLKEEGLAEVYCREVSDNGHRPYVTELPQEAYCDNWLTTNGLTILRDFPAGQPWHIAFNFTGPHGPFGITKDMKESAENKEMPPPYANTMETHTRYQGIRTHYAAMIENIDKQIGDILSVVETRGELDNTLIVFSSDHGDMLGDHNRGGKCIWYEPSAHIPLIAAGPGTRRGVKTGSLVQLHDVCATFIDYAEGEPLPNADAKSLRGCLEDEKTCHRDFVSSELTTPDKRIDWTMVFDSTWKAVRDRANERCHLYNIVDDPMELRDRYPSNSRLAETLLRKRP